MFYLARIIAACLCAVPLWGCETFQVLTFSGHAESGYQQSALTLELIGDTPTPPPGNNPGKTDFETYCQTSGQAEFLPILVPFAVATGTFVVDKTSQSIQDWLTKKQKEFQTSASATSNSDAFLRRNPSDKKFYPNLQCIVIKQSVTAKNASKNAPTDQEAFVFAGRIQVSKDLTAFKIYPTFYKLSRATALTDSTSGKIDIDLKVTFNVVGAGDSAAQKSSGLGTIDLSLKGVALAADATGAVAHSVQDPTPDKRLGSSGESVFLPVVPSDSMLKACAATKTCTALEPVSITAILSETGTGSDAFGQLAKDVSDNTKTIETAVTSAVQAATAAPKTGTTTTGK